MSRWCRRAGRKDIMLLTARRLTGRHGRDDIDIIGVDSRRWPEFRYGPPTIKIMMRLPQKAGEKIIMICRPPLSEADWVTFMRCLGEMRKSRLNLPLVNQCGDNGERPDENNKCFSPTELRRGRHQIIEISSGTGWLGLQQQAHGGLLGQNATMIIFRALRRPGRDHRLDDKKYHHRLLEQERPSFYAICQIENNLTVAPTAGQNKKIGFPST